MHACEYEWVEKSVAMKWVPMCACLSMTVFPFLNYLIDRTTADERPSQSPPIVYEQLANQLSIKNKIKPFSIKYKQVSLIFYYIDKFSEAGGKDNGSEILFF